MIDDNETVRLQKGLALRNRRATVERSRAWLDVAPAIRIQPKTKKVSDGNGGVVEQKSLRMTVMPENPNISSMELRPKVVNIERAGPRWDAAVALYMAELADEESDIEASAAEL